MSFSTHKLIATAYQADRSPSFRLAYRSGGWWQAPSDGVGGHGRRHAQVRQSSRAESDDRGTGGHRPRYVARPEQSNVRHVGRWNPGSGERPLPAADLRRVLVDSRRASLRVLGERPTHRGPHAVPAIRVVASGRGCDLYCGRGKPLVASALEDSSGSARAHIDGLADARYCIKPAAGGSLQRRSRGMRRGPRGASAFSQCSARLCACWS